MGSGGWWCIRHEGRGGEGKGRGREGCPGSGWAEGEEPALLCAPPAAAACLRKRRRGRRTAPLCVCLDPHAARPWLAGGTISQTLARSLARPCPTACARARPPVADSAGVAGRARACMSLQVVRLCANSPGRPAPNPLHRRHHARGCRRAGAVRALRHLYGLRCVCKEAGRHLCRKPDVRRWGGGDVHAAGWEGGRG